jgi:Lysyl oxidase
MIMSAPTELEFDRSTMPGRVLLRATSSINNRGLGPLEVSAHRIGRHRWRTYQAIYDRRGHRHVFPARASLVFKHVSGQRYGVGFVGDASYWKLAHLASFQLWSVGPHLRALRLVRTGPKVDYCLRDLTRTRPSRRSPAGPVYGACNEDPGLRHDVFGTSVGWSDIYPYSYPQQWIDVTGLRGRFAFVLIADPRHAFAESDERNNVSETYLRLPSGRVLGHRVAVSRP